MPANPLPQLALQDVVYQQQDAIIFNGAAIPGVAASSQAFLIFYLNQADEQNGYGTVIQLDDATKQAAIFADLNPEYSHLFYLDEQQQLQTLLWCIEFATRQPDGLFVNHGKVYGRGISEAELQAMIARSVTSAAPPPPAAPAAPPAPMPAAPLPAVQPQPPVMQPQAAPTMQVDELALPPLPNVPAPAPAPTMPPAPQPQAQPQVAMAPTPAPAPTTTQVDELSLPALPTEPAIDPMAIASAPTSSIRTEAAPLTMAPPAASTPAADYAALAAVPPAPAPAPAPVPAYQPAAPASELALPPLLEDLSLSAPAAPVAPPVEEFADLPPLPDLPALPPTPAPTLASRPVTAKAPVGRPPKPLVQDRLWMISAEDFTWLKAISRQPLERNKDVLRQKMVAQIERNMPELAENWQFHGQFEKAFEAVALTYELVPGLRHDLLKALLNGRIVDSVVKGLSAGQATGQ